mmetsp:Transcript_40776/g.105804  ORF Transcript_40776/g.105804 Transcript_40776/m.105804 type:complete len:227 (-) Transcript_40776:396-1076(-)
MNRRRRNSFCIFNAASCRREYCADRAFTRSSCDVIERSAISSASLLSSSSFIFLMRSSLTSRALAAKLDTLRMALAVEKMASRLHLADSSKKWNTFSIDFILSRARSTSFLFSLILFALDIELRPSDPSPSVVSSSPLSSSSLSSSDEVSNSPSSSLPSARSLPLIQLAPSTAPFNEVEEAEVDEVWLDGCAMSCAIVFALRLRAALAFRLDRYACHAVLTLTGRS